MRDCLLFIKYLFRGRDADEELVRALKRKKRAYWEQVDYDSWHRTLRGTFQDEVEKRALGRIPVKRGGVIVDVGVGSGRTLEFLEGRVIGSDLSLALLRAAMERAENLKKEFYPIAADSSRLPFKDGRFDVVISCRMLQHAFNWRETLGEITRLVDRGGEMVLLLYNSFSGYGVVRNAIAAYYNFLNWEAVRAGREPPFEYFGHFNTPLDIKRELMKLGFTVEEVKGAGLFPVEVFPEGALRFLMPLARAVEPLAGVFPFSHISGRLVVLAKKNVKREE